MHHSIAKKDLTSKDSMGNLSLNNFQNCMGNHIT